MVIFVMKKFLKYLLLFLIGGFSYGLIEILWRRYTHWSMVITGGFCFTALFRCFTKFNKLPLYKKCIIGSTIITVIEFAVGCIVNIWLKLKVWDYSCRPLNLCGQVCLLYSSLWGLLCIPVNYICHALCKLKPFQSLRK